MLINKNNQFHFLASVIFLLLAFSNAVAQRALVNQGNDEYEKKQYRNAEDSYKKALSENSGSFAGRYNLGNALYRQEKYDEAAKEYLQSFTSDDEYAVKEDAYYNMGNALVKAQKYEEAIEAYKQALKMNPADEESRYNLSYAMQMLKKQQQQQKSDKNKKDQQQKKDKQQQQKQQDQQQKQDQQQQQKKQQAPPPKLSKEEAERMLKALRNDEKNLQKEKAKKQAVQVSGPTKNW